MSGRRLPGALVPALGFAGIIAIGGLVTCFSGLAEFTTGLIVALAVTGFALAWPLKGRSLSLWPILGAFGVFLVFGAPVIFSGEAGFAGYIKLDDTSTWLAFTDHVLAYGHSTSGLAPSSYEATVQINLSAGYPLGAFIPLAVGHELTGTDAAWLFQPYMALMAALMSLVFFDLLRRVIPGVGARSALVFIAAQPALLVGYAHWGGIKEVATALLVALLAAATTPLARPGTSRSLRGLTPAPIVAGAALVGVMGAGGAPWLLAIALAAVALMAVAAWRARPSAGLVRIYVARSLTVAGGVALIGLPTVFAAGGFFSPDQGPLTSGGELGNLIEALEPAQYAGPWPVGDFRLSPDSGLVSAILIIATALAWGFGVLAAVRDRAAALLVFAFGTGLGSLIVFAVGSPWIQGKALATGTASFLIMALAGIGWLLSGGVDRGDRSDRTGAGRLKALGAFLLIVPVGVLVSNALAYHESWLTPRAQLAELEEIGDRFAGQGPALMTEYQPYGVRHFLRLADAEGASELRRRAIPRRDGSEPEKGAWTDTDALALTPDREGLFTYPTLVLRRNPLQSRPPSPYNLVERGEYYDVWQRPPGFDPAGLVAHVSFGDDLDPGVVPRCAVIEELGRRAGSGGTVIAAPRDPNAVATLDSFPGDWVSDPGAGTLTPFSDGSATGTVEVPAPGRYSVYVGGSARGRIEVSIGGILAGSARNRLNNNAQYIELGDLDLEPGAKLVVLSYERGGPLRPGTGAYPFGLGPVILSPSPPDGELVEVPAAEATRLCGARLDWAEAFRS